jgi:hypothetical protein
VLELLERSTSPRAAEQRLDLQVGIAATLEAGQVEQLVHHGAQLVGIATDAREEVGAPLVVEALPVLLERLR